MAAGELVPSLACVQPPSSLDGGRACVPCHSQRGSSLLLVLIKASAPGDSLLKCLTSGCDQTRDLHMTFETGCRPLGRVRPGADPRVRDTCSQTWAGPAARTSLADSSTVPSVAEKGVDVGREQDAGDAGPHLQVGAARPPGPSAPPVGTRPLLPLRHRSRFSVPEPLVSRGTGFSLLGVKGCGLCLRLTRSPGPPRPHLCLLCPNWVRDCVYVTQSERTGFPSPSRGPAGSAPLSACHRVPWGPPHCLPVTHSARGRGCDHRTAGGHTWTPGITSTGR